MSILKKYEIQSGQKIKKDKSAIFMYQNAAAARTLLVQECTSLITSTIPLKYLGCPISHKRRRKEHYFDLITRVKSELQDLNGNMLSYGGKEVLINSVLQCVSIHVLSARIHGMIFCLLKKEGCLCFRFLFYLCQDFYAKIYWRFILKTLYGPISCWINMVRSKSLVWYNWGVDLSCENILNNRDIFELLIWWEPRSLISVMLLVIRQG